MSDAQQRIDELVKTNEVLLFMKGTASFPMCGFSGRAIQILKRQAYDRTQSEALIQAQRLHAWDVVFH